MRLTNLYLIIPTNQSPHTSCNFWNNEQGWVSIWSADVFTERERYMLNLPMGGKWVKVSAAVTQG